MGKRMDRVPVDPAGRGARTYRRRVSAAGLTPFRVVCQETDLMVLADRPLIAETREIVLAGRGYIETYIQRHPDFASTLMPWSAQSMAPKIVREMITAGRAAGVGPMAAVAGAIAETVGRQLLTLSRQVVVENGGDIFLKTDQAAVAALFAGRSPLSMRVGLRLPETGDGIGVCSSSGTVGHSWSAGSADLVCIIADSCALADAAATAIANRINSARDISGAIAFGRRIAGLRGIVVVVGDRMAAWGAVELVPLKTKKG